MNAFSPFHASWSLNKRCAKKVRRGNFLFPLRCGRIMYAINCRAGKVLFAAQNRTLPIMLTHAEENLRTIRKNCSPGRFFRSYGIFFNSLDILPCALESSRAIERSHATGAIEGTRSTIEKLYTNEWSCATAFIVCGTEVIVNTFKRIRVRWGCTTPVAGKSIFFADFAHNQIGQPINVLCAQFSSPPF